MNRTFFLQFISVILIISGIIIFSYTTYMNSSKQSTVLVYNEKTMLAALWNNSKIMYLEPATGRTVDKQNNNITTSEGQSYTMLRAVWQSDQTTFDLAWKWTKANLRHLADPLFSWKWGIKPDGTYGIDITAGYQNSASDADSDIALALSMAAEKWQNKTYLDEAKVLISAIWEKEVEVILGKPYLLANDLEKLNKNSAIINPSYISPYSYRIFAKLDSAHDWNSLVGASYDLLDASTTQKLNTGSSANLPPDWITINKATGELTNTSADLSTNFSYDAIRTPWRVALDYQWYQEPRAKNYLSKLSKLADYWTQNGRLVSTYTHDGKPLTSDEVPAVYGATLGYFIVERHDLAKQIYDTKLKSLFDATENKWNTDLPYYSDEWAWFGMALYQNQLPNLATKL